jgi:hypothetical protein
MTFSLDPEVGAVLQAALEKNGPPAGDVQTRRAALDAMLDYFNNQAQPPAADVLAAVGHPSDRLHSLVKVPDPCRYNAEPGPNLRQYAAVHRGGKQVRRASLGGQPRISQMLAPPARVSPACAARLAMTPDLCATTGCSIFIASRTTTRSPSLTC